MTKQLRQNLSKKVVPITLIIVLLLTLVPFTQLRASAYAESLGNVISAYANGDFINITVDNGTEPGDDILELQVCENDILRVNYRPNGISSSPSTPIIDPDKTWSAVGASINTSTNPMTIQTSDMRIEIQKYPCRMTVKKSDGTVLFWEASGSGGGVFHDGVRFVRSPGQNMYGLHSYSCFEENGDLLRNNDNGYSVNGGYQGSSGGPFMWSTAGYGLLVDSDGGYPYLNSTDNKMEFYYGGTPEQGRRYEKENVEYYIMLGQPEGVMENYAHITGTSPLMPEWSMGFSNYQWGIDQNELYNVVETYRAKNIPIDSYGLDYDWKNYGQDNYGEFTWNTTKFPNSSTNQLKDDMNDLGMKLIGITKPRIVTKHLDGTTWTQQGAYANSHNFFYPGHPEYRDYFDPYYYVRSIDPYKADARAWIWEHSIGAYDKGIAGWWNDETDKIDSNGTSNWFGNYTTLHMSQAMYEGQRSYTNDETRVWQTARGYYPGTQRYGTTIWSGDVGAGFYKGELSNPWPAGLNEQKATMLSTINTGQMKWGSDGGGFNPADQAPSPELYTRWVQMSTFVPVDRVHGQLNQKRQPWQYGYTAEEATKAANQLRYSLIPYMYSYEYKAMEKGVGLVKPLMYDYPNDQTAANYTDAWMFGDWLLVAPVTERYQTTHWIYLPAGEWIDYNTGVVYNGGQYIPYSIDNVTWTDMPMFIKKGAIIPTQKVLDYTTQETITDVFVDVFADTAKTTNFTFCDDDGTSYDYENGEFYKQVISAKDNGASGINVNFAAKTGSYNSDVEYFYAKIHGKSATNVTVNGSAIPARTDFNALKATGGQGYATGKDIYGDVTYVKVTAGTAKNIVATGSTSVAADGTYYEAEDASLSGKTIATKAGANNNHTGYTGWGFADSLSGDDAAVTFYAKTKAGGEFPVNIRYSNGTGSNKTMSIYVNGAYSTQATFAPTANWDSWSTLETDLQLTSGLNIITVQYDADNGDTGSINIDNAFVPFFPEVARYEAESAALHNGTARATNHWFYSGSGFVAGVESVGTEVEFRDFPVENSGTYQVNLRYANGNGTSKTLNMYVNGSYYTTATLTSPSSNWNEWSTWSQNVALQAGKNTISFKYDSGNSGYVNLDTLDIKYVSAANITGTNLLDNGSFERPTNESSNWTEWHPTGQTLAYGVDQGITLSPPETAREGDKRAYFYLANAYQQSIHQSVGVANGTYKVEFWVRSVGTTPSIARCEVTPSGSSSIYTNIAPTSQWKHYTISNISANGSIDVGFYVNSPGGTTVQIDGVKLVKTG
ncbi:MAG: DUF4968 domain-containing protein [Oscillospiraceae bacterium]|jgi:alpha-glucosidase (family GH31 glycosyl hydrolase)|nr:DUF4968 domain-containing protein [Oscillospiraceae bacterium]